MIIEALQEKKGEDILWLDIQKLTTFADYFVICTATSDRMLRALAEGVLDKTAERGVDQGRQEGRSEDGWVVLDYGNIVVHLLMDDLRRYYRLEELWGDGKVVLRLK